MFLVFLLLQSGQKASCSYLCWGEIHSWEGKWSADAFLQRGELWHSNCWPGRSRSKQRLCCCKFQSRATGGRLSGVGDAGARARQRLWRKQASDWSPEWGQARVRWSWATRLWNQSRGADQPCPVTDGHAGYVAAGPSQDSRDAGANAISHHGKTPDGAGRWRQEFWSVK